MSLAGVAGISFAAIFIRFALPAPPVVTGFYRMVFASALMGAYLVWRRQPLGIARRPALLAVASGLCFGSDLAMWNTSVVHTSVANATLLVNTTPVYVDLWSVLVLRQRLHSRFVDGAALGLSGAALLLGISWGEDRHTSGALLALGAGVFYSGYILSMSAARRTGDVLPILFLSSCTSTVIMGVYAWLGGDAFHGFPVSSWAAIAGAALVSQVGGVLGIAWALRYLPPTVASVALLGQPVGTTILGWWLLGEPLSPVQALGALAVLAGIGLAARSQGRNSSPDPDSGGAHPSPR